MSVKVRMVAIAAVVACLVSPVVVQAGIIFSDTLDSSAGWTINQDPDTVASFGYDYSADGVPVAPHTTDGSTSGLRMAANVFLPGDAAELSVLPTGLNASGLYTVQFDFWANSNGPFPGGGGGSTEFIGGGVGHDGTTAGRNGASLIVTSEGGSSRDWRMYKDANEQFIASGQYNISDNNSAGPELSAAYPGQPAPASQVAAFPGPAAGADQTGTLQDGAGGFQWMTMLITVNSNAGTANYQVTSAVSGNTVDIGTVDSNVGDAVSTSGGVALIYADLFSSVADNNVVAFGLYDNVVVTQVPEPSTAVLGCLALFGFVAVRRRK